MNQLQLGITIALRDMFSMRAHGVERSFRSLDDTAYRASRSIRTSMGNVELGFAEVLRIFAAGAAVLGAVIFPTKKAMEYGKALSEIATIADQATFSMKRLSDALVRQTLKYPTTPVDQARAAYEAVSTGFLNTDDAIHVVDVATQTAVTTLTDTDTALNGLITTMNAYTLAAQDAGWVSDQLFQTIRYGRVRMGELAHNIGMVAPAAATSGIAMHELLGTYATMTLGGLSPEQSAQYLRQLILGIVKPTAQAKGEASQLGLDWSMQGMHRAGGFRNLLTQAWDMTGGRGNVEGFARLLSGRQAFAGAATLIKQRHRWGGIVEKVRSEQATDEFGIKMPFREFAMREREKALDFQWGRLKSAALSFFVVLGAATTNYLTPFVRALANLVGGVTLLLQRFPLIGKVIMAHLTSVGLGIMAFGLFRLRMLMTSFAVKRLAWAASELNYRLLGVSLTSRNVLKVFSGQMILIGLLIYALRRAWETNWHGMFDKVQHGVLLFRALTTALGSIKGEWGQIPEELAVQLEKAGVWDTFVYWFRILGRAREMAKGVAEGIRAFFRGVASAAAEIAGRLVELVARVSGPRAKALKEWFKSLHLESSAVARWKQIGFYAGRILGLFIFLVAVNRLWLSAVMLTVGALRLLRMAAWTAVLPFKLFKFGRDFGGGLYSAMTSLVVFARLKGRQFNRAVFGWARPRGGGPGFGGFHYDPRYGYTHSASGVPTPWITSRQAGLRARMQERVHNLSQRPFLGAPLRGLGSLRASFRDLLVWNRAKAAQYQAASDAFFLRLGARLRSLGTSAGGLFQRGLLASGRGLAYLRGLGSGFGRLSGVGSRAFAQIEEVGLRAMARLSVARYRLFQMGGDVRFDRGTGKWLRDRGLGGGRGVRSISPSMVNLFRRLRYDPRGTLRAGTATSRQWLVDRSMGASRFLAQRLRPTRIRAAISRLALRDTLTNVGGRIRNLPTAALNQMRRALAGVRSGLVSLAGGFRRMGMAAWGAVRGGVRGAITGLRTLAVTAWTSARAALASLAGGFRRATIAALRFARAGIVAVIRGLWAMAASAIASAWAAFVGMGPLGWAIVALIAIIGLIIWKWDAVKKFVGKMWQWLKDLWGKTPVWLKMLILAPIQQIKLAFMVLKTVALWVWDKMLAGLHKLKPAFDWLIRAAKAVGKFLGIYDDGGGAFDPANVEYPFKYQWQIFQDEHNKPLGLDQLQGNFQKIQDFLLDNQPYRAQLPLYDWYQRQANELKRRIEAQGGSIYSDTFGGGTDAGNDEADAAYGGPTASDIGNATGAAVGRELRKSPLTFDRWPTEAETRDPYAPYEARYLQRLAELEASRNRRNQGTETMTTESEMLSRGIEDLKGLLDRALHRPVQGDVHLDGRKVGRIVGGHQADQANVQRAGSYVQPVARPVGGR
jgi:TP901 family phage tail tape measure protein